MSDYIKRENAIEAMENRFADIIRTHKRRVTTGEKAIASDMIETAKMVKSAYVAPVRHGHWIKKDIYDSVCSVCGTDETEYIYGTEMWYGNGKSKYCPNCGARMDGESDE